MTFTETSSKVNKSKFTRGKRICKSRAVIKKIFKHIKPLVRLSCHWQRIAEFVRRHQELLPFLLLSYWGRVLSQTDINKLHRHLMKTIQRSFHLQKILIYQIESRNVIAHLCFLAKRDLQGMIKNNKSNHKLVRSLTRQSRKTPHYVKMHTRLGLKNEWVAYKARPLHGIGTHYGKRLALNILFQCL